MSSIAVTEKGEIRRLELTTSPHLHSQWTTKKVMWMVVLALLPCVVTAVLFFGFHQLMIIAVAVGFSFGTEAVIQKFRKKKISINDGSAAITGLLLALTLPPDFSLSGTAIGAVVAIGLGKQIFGGLGFNIFNPALVGRAFLQAAFPVAMTTWSIPHYAVDTISSATPLAAFKFDKITAGLESMFFGNIGGSIGETSAVAILAGGLFLIVIGIVNWRIPSAMIIGILLFGGLLWLIDPAKNPSPVFHIFAGGFLFGMFFMATDWVTSPVTKKGMWIYGITISCIIIIIRVFGGLPEGVMYSILIMNGFVPLINRFTNPKVFGAAV